MIEDISFGGYLPGDSVLHRLDPRTKLLGMAVLLLAAFANSNASGILLTAAAVVALAWLTRTGWRVWAWGLSRFAWMLVVVAGANLFFRSGGELIYLGEWELPFTVEGVQTGLKFTVQVLEAIMLSMILTFTTTPRQLSRAAQRFASPLTRLKVPVEDLGVVLLLAIRFIPLLQQELRTIIDAQRSRGVEFRRGNLLVRSHNLAAVLVPALVATLRRADTLALAMTARGFVPGQPRSEYRPLRFSEMDYAATICLAAFLAVRIFVSS
ncbi:MAG: energy-coupling factor transporter transmembrane protein EcfT [Desulfomonile tiedjei]|nr:energy-coupling factor transporter transmembrane protein EcfT [Desulfomonile tiedjei]